MTGWRMTRRWNRVYAVHRFIRSTLSPSLLSICYKFERWRLSCSHLNQLTRDTPISSAIKSLMQCSTPALLRTLRARWLVRPVPRPTWSWSLVLVNIEQQSPDIAQGVHGHLTKRPEEIGAGDQGHMFGYATDETPELMPLSHVLATKLGARLTEVRKNGTCPWLRPDGKTQVTVEYYNDKGAMVPVRVHTVLISTQHDETVTNDEIAADLKEHIEYQQNDMIFVLDFELLVP
ncbi:unnamed protein product [Fraxinus pennsylvanica]|uniref:methionine adenosyltransferase n=1 Tax=Fraxinus pennsylvanica TaxID=56036 RepID=A0AAD2DSR6_9LAMI|nr:unnamed protein product [Fraxinus pennsylvanica]